MDVKSIFSRAVAMMSATVAKVEDHQLVSQTPCTEWNLKQLLNHIASELAWMPPLLAGNTIAQVGSTLDGDLLGATPIEAMQKYITDAQTAVTTAAVATSVHLSAGDTMAYKYIEEVAADVLIHGWDVAKSVGLDYKMDADLIEWEKIKMTELMQKYAGSNAFGAPLQVDNLASEQTKLLAMLGRQG